MKVFAKVLAIIAVLLILCALLQVLLCTVFQKEIWVYGYDIFGKAVGSPTRVGILQERPVVPAGTFLAILLQLMLTVPMIFLAGRKKLGIWPEATLLLLMVLTLPITKVVGDFVSWYLIEGNHYSFQRVDEILQRYYEWKSCINYVIDMRPFGAINYCINQCARLAEVAQILNVIVCGMSIGLYIKNRKSHARSAKGGAQ